ncbi:hypothetical protein V1226_07005 [Lachnospiraceae bacterium JLR.KK009]
MKKKYIPVREVLIFLAMLAFLLNYLGNKKDRQEVHAKNGVQAEESSQRGEGEETEEQNPNRESAGEQATDDGSGAVGEETPDGENEGKTLADWKEEIEKNVPSQEQAGAGSQDAENAGDGNQNTESADAKDGGAQPGEESLDLENVQARKGGSAGEQAEANSPNGNSTTPVNGAAQAGEGNVYTSTAASGANPENAGQADALPSVQEGDIYSFLQGPGSWGERRSWSGEWCEFEIDGNRFGGFGCGLCCMTNVYDTLSPYEVSPWDMFENARVASDYSPGGEYGAIDWQEMRCTLDVCGISGELHKKPPTFEEFRAQVRGALTAIVLVSNGNEDTYWPNTKGHYVNIWLYERDDTIFLAEPGNPGRNRTRIPLRHIYDSLKMGSSYQYLLVTGYSEEENRWRASGISENWCRPEGW